MPVKKATKVVKAAKAAKVVKSVSPKSATRKPEQKTKKPRVTKSPQKAALVCASGEQCFWMSDGTVLSNLVELHNALESMAEDIFGYHVTKDKNDFADWVEQVLNDEELAALLRKAKKPHTARTAVVRRLKHYNV